ncbi:Cholesterol 7-desaturase [Diplonema papillatum]|nr:Cholesterol 7-desaturase [Diplonema papillatum]KAJ9458515.1 Cholesterol 7-desaturase [Diplonema papillatum]KAJ9458516.1 Cholesterol 7-desaturase [Diplonema papillatum]
MMGKSCVLALLCAAGCAALIPSGNATFDEVTVNAWMDWAQDFADDYAIPVALDAAEWVQGNCWLVAGVLVGLWLFRWNRSILIFEGGWQGAGRPPISKRIALDMMPPFPNGWFKILDAKDLKPGKVRSVQACGKQMVAFRTMDGKLGILDAYCPHLGANLAHHGKVVDNCVVCPFHAWRFNTDGECEGIEYSDSVPPGSAIRSYPAFEALNMIYVWYDAEGREPSWFPRNDENVSNGKWKHAAWSGHEILTHISEIPENGADSAHLNVVHKDFIFTHRDIPEKPTPIQHKWSATWEVDSERPWVTNMTVSMRHILGFDFLNKLGVGLDVEANQVGPGLVYLYINTVVGTVLMAQSVTPIGQFRQRVEHNYFACPNIPRWFAKAVAWAACRQFHRDIDLWEQKTWHSRPLLVKGDGPIQRYRAWFKTFYSENSTPFGSPDECGTAW